VVILILILALVAFLTIGLLAFFVVLVIGIHDDERHMRLTRAPRTCAGAASRRVLVGVRCPERDGKCTTSRER